MSMYPRKQTSRGELRIHESLNDLFTDLADYIAEVSDKAVKERGVFAIALTGGSLLGLSEKLCKTPYPKLIDWTKWYIFWTDERIITHIHRDCNSKLTKQELILKCPIYHSRMHPISVLKTAVNAAAEYEFGIRQHVKSRIIQASDPALDCPKFDLVLLDMGSDGHVASLFPGQPSLQSKDWITAAINCPQHPPERITITMPVINAASNVVVVATGKEKAHAVKKAIITPDDAGPKSSSSPSSSSSSSSSPRPKVPARMIDPIDGKLVWFFDKPAAAKLGTAVDKLVTAADKKVGAAADKLGTAPGESSKS